MARRWHVASSHDEDLCTDHLHGYLKIEEIPSIVSEGGSFSIKRLISLANTRGGKDNITIVLVRVAG